jgi:glycine cleavage system H protein
MNIPESLKYTKDHEWVQMNGDAGTVGITDHAQGELGDVVFVEVPAAGKSVKQGESFGTIEAVKAVADLFAPVTGTIIEVNQELSGTPELVNKDPYGKGWMVKIRLTNPGEVSSLLDAATYAGLVGTK